MATHDGHADEIGGKARLGGEDLLDDGASGLMDPIDGAARRVRGRTGAAPATAPARQVAADPNNPASWGKVGRNAPCPCGSGKKYKHCHGQFA